MRILFILGAIFFASACWAKQSQADELAGTWFYYEKIYDGNIIPEPADADLRLYFEFDGKGNDHLYWGYTDDPTQFCSRKGNYTWDGKTLQDHIIWVDPNNGGNCGRDPDMQLGRTSIAPLVLANGDLQLTVDLGDDTLIYVWKKIGPPSP